MAFSLRRVLVVATVAVITAGTIAGTVPTAQARPPRQHRRSTIRPQVHHDTSAPLRSLAVVPIDDEPREDEPVPRMPQRPVATVADPVVQASVVPAAPTTSTSFDGLGQGFSGPQGAFSVTGIPPDPNASVGATQIVETVNTGFAVFSKTGTALYGPVNTNTLFSGFGGPCQTTDDGDAVVRYDSLAGRWVITQFANVQTSGPFYECVAVSTTSDATGTWNRYSYQYSSFPDYPKLSVWPDAYYVTYNLFNAAGTAFLGAEVCALNRSAMLTGGTANQQCFTTSTSYGGLLAADLEGGTAPPSGAANVVMSLGTTATTLAYWKYHVDWTTPANSTFSGPATTTVASYTTACGTSGTCIPQPSTSQQLDSLSDRLMFRLAYRNLGDHESLVVNHAVTAGGVTGIRWYELRLSSSGSPVVYQQSTYAPDSTSRWMGSTSIDRVGNIALGYSASSSSINPQIRITGRLPGDTAGTMTQGETTLAAGAGHQTSYSRWGDYTSMAVDPADGCTFWYTDEYLPSTGNFNWRTRIASFQLPGCSAPVGNDFSIAASPASGSVTAGSAATTTVSTTLQSGSAQTIALSATGLPSGTMASFSPGSVSSGGSSTLTLATSTSTAAGSYPITITGTGTSATHSTGYTLTVAGGGGGVSNGGFESGLTGWASTGSTAAVSTPVHGGSGAARIGSTSPSTDSTLSQTFTAPGTATGLTFFYRMTCPDTITYDWFTATLRDNTTSTTTTIRSKVCSTNSSYTAVTAAVAGGHSYTLTLTNHDDNYAGDASYTYVDDIATT